MSNTFRAIMSILLGIGLAFLGLFLYTRFSSKGSYAASIVSDDESIVDEGLSVFFFPKISMFGYNKGITPQSPLNNLDGLPGLNNR